MKIEWLNERMTEAIVTRGKRWARVRSDHWNGEDWQFVETGAFLGVWMSWRIYRRRRAALSAADRARRDGKEWQPVHSLPRAEVRR